MKRESLILRSLGLVAVLFALGLAAPLSAANQAENFKDGSVYVSNPSPCLGDTITLYATVLNTDYPTDGAGQVDIKAEMVGSSSYPGCGTSTTTVLANRWWVVYNTTTSTTPAAPATDYNSIGQGGNGYQISGLPSGNPTWSTTQIQVPITIMNTPAALGINYLMVYLKGNYVDPTGITGFDDEVCIPLNVGSSGCTAPPPSGNVYKRVVGTASSGNIMVYWLDYNFFNDTGLTITDAIPACETILAYAPNPKDGTMPTPAGNSITWTLPDANATSTPYPLESQGSVWVEVSVGAACAYPLANTATYAGGSGLAGSSNTLSQANGQNVILNKQEFDVNFNQINSASSVTLGTQVNYVLQYNISGQVLKCFDPFNYTLGTAMPAANASPSWGGSWMADSQTDIAPAQSGAGDTQWNIVSYNGDKALQFMPGSAGSSDYRAIFYTCAAASAQVAACTNVEIITDVRLDDATNQGQDVGVWLQNDNAVCASGYMLVVSGDNNAGNAVGHISVQRNNGTCGAGCCSWTACCQSNTFYSGQWYTVDALEVSPGVIDAKFWARGTPEPVGWQLQYTDPIGILPCPGANNHIGLGGQGAKTEYDNFQVVVPQSVTNASVWDTVPASIAFQSTAPTATGQPAVGSSGGLIHWDFTGNNFGANAGVLYSGQGSFTWVGLAECPASNPVKNYGVIGGVVGATAMQSFSNTVTLNITCGTPTYTQTVTATPTYTNTRTPTPTSTHTPTSTNTPSATPTYTDTVTSTDTSTRTNTPTDTLTSTDTPTYTQTVTSTSTDTATVTSTRTPTYTQTVTSTSTDTRTVTPTNTPSSTATSTNTLGSTPTFTITPSATPTYTDTSTATPTYTQTVTRTDTPTVTPTPTDTSTQSPGPSATSTDTPTDTSTATPTSTVTATYTQTITYTDTSTVTPTPTDTSTKSPGPSSTDTDTPTDTSTVTPTYTVTPTSTQTITFTDTFTATPTRTVTLTSTDTAQNTASDTPTCTDTPTASATATDTSTRTATSTITYTRTETVTATPTATFTDTFTATPTRTSTVTFTDSPTITVSPTITLTPVPMPFQLVVTIYNSAGEVVRGLYSGPVQVLPTSVNLSSSSSTNPDILATGGTLTLSLPGQLGNGATSLTWSGTNDQGQPVVSGIYTFKLELVDQYGHISTLNQQVTVMDTQGQNVLAVYNSAGELVYHEVLTRLPPSVVSFTLQSPSFVAAFDASGNPLPGTGLLLTYQDVNGVTYTEPWYGVGMDGQALSSGVYTVQLLRTVGSSSSILESQQVTLIRRGGQLQGGAKVYPNPIMGNGKATLSFLPSAGAIAQAQVFNMASERVLVQSALSESGSMTLDTSHLSAGIYVVEFTKKQNDSILVRQLIKVAIIK